MKYDLVIFDIDGTLCPSGRILNEEELKLIDTTAPKEFKKNNLDQKVRYPTFKDVVNTLEKIKENSKLGIASNGPSWRQRNKLIAAGIDNIFDRELVIISEELALFYHSLDTELNCWPNNYAKEEYLKRVEKPNSSMLGHLLTRANTSNQRAVYVGNAKKDLLAAQNIGLEFIRIIDKEKEDFKADKEIPQSEFHKLINLI